ncbi:MAG: TIGR03757 family integrating conjugative element protein [bacterium]
MIIKIQPTHFVLQVAVPIALFAGSVVHAGNLVEAFPSLIEVFATAELPVASMSDLDQQPGSKETELHVYDIDGIQRIEAYLSEGLTDNPEHAKNVVLQRTQNLDDQVTTKMQMAAQGLAKAMQYGVDRYPAIVFDGQAVVYGVTDVQTALAHYQSWQREGKR